MMNTSAAMTRLIWKDAITIKPLVIAVVAGIVAFHLIAVIGGYLAGTQTWTIGPFLSLWILMPNLLAIGAPAMLVGTEEDAGTLRWLRTLPVKWQHVVGSKLIVAFLSLLGVWAIASLVVFIVSIAIPHQYDAMASDLFSYAGVASLLFYSLLLLLTGFVTAYLIRSPIGALLLLMPLMIAQSIFSGIFAKSWFLDPFHRAYPVEPFGGFPMLALCLLGIGYLIILWMLQRWLGKRRMINAERSYLLGLSDDLGRPYRPPARLIHVKGKPTPYRALMWQQSRQIAPLASALVLLAIVSLLWLKLVPMPSYGQRNLFQHFQELAFPILFLCVIWLGVLVFYGDSVRRRCSYFADRGISPTMIWWTRLLVPGLACLAIAALTLAPSAGKHLDTWPVNLSFAGMLVVVFAVSQFASQITARPILSFLVAPIIVIFYTMLAVATFAFYPTYIPVIAIAVVVLLFATWRLTPRWLSERPEKPFYIRAFGYGAAAALVPILTIYVARVSTTPSFREDWRTAMFAKSDAWQAALPQKIQDRQNVEISPNAYGRSSGYYLLVPELTDIIPKLKNELADKNGIGNNVGFSQLKALFTSDHDLLANERLRDENLTEAKRLALQVLAKWSHVVREEVAEVRGDLYLLTAIADPAEALLINNMDASLGTPEQMAEIAAMIPDAELRKRSREVALVQAWRNYQDQSWYQEGYGYQKNFSNQSVSHMIAWLPFERRRADRFLDEAVKMTHDRIATGLPQQDSLEYLEWQKLWSQVGVQPTSTARSQFANWTRDHQTAIARIRK
ncbi:ABC-2 family transporter protein [Planctomycetes bacterium CA13]|uniref:ABC-2 family transporter protein n=1 Tax=Novipirellula herctigrandis TaxID=2527986 RepID=A0A5C5Z7M3_9BACT|nr:ABC-2 family transporter protein [Planctomycetes bacterium CA13]